MPGYRERLHVVTYVATLDVPREVVLFLSRLLAAERKLRGTRKGTRALTCFHQAVMALRHFREGTDPATLARDHGIGRSTGYRYIDEATDVLADPLRQAQVGHPRTRSLRVAAVDPSTLPGRGDCSFRLFRDEVVGGGGASLVQP
ncbi:hypothetical protein [Nocardiopsis oceani]